MDKTLIASLISACAAIIVCLINNAVIRKESDRKHEANIVLVSYKIDQLEKEVAKNNQVIERQFNLEKRQDVIEEQIKVANHRIEDLEKGA